MKNKNWGVKATLRWEPATKAAKECSHDPRAASPLRPYSHYCRACGACAYTVNTVVKLG